MRALALVGLLACAAHAASENSSQAFTAVQLLNTPSICTNGQYPRGVDVGGNATNCSAPSGTISGGVANTMAIYATATSITPATNNITNVSTGTEVFGNISLDATTTLPAASTLIVSTQATTPLDIFVSSVDVAGVFNSTGSTASGSASLYWAPVSSQTYELRFGLLNVSGGAAEYAVQFGTGATNGTCDNAQHYVSCDRGIGVNGGCGAITTNFGISIHDTSGFTVGVLSNGAVHGALRFYTIEGSSTTWYADGLGTANLSNSDVSTAFFGGGYSSGVPVTQICVTGTSNWESNALTRDKKFNAHLELWIRGQKHL